MTEPLPWTLEELLPHEHPMILIDAVAEDGEDFFAEVRIAEDRPFFEPGKGVPSYVGIEYIAQTVAALVGLQALREDGRVRVGYLLGTRRYHASRPWFPIGERLTVRVAGEFESMGLARYQGEIRDASGEQIVTCSVTLYAGSNEEERE